MENIPAGFAAPLRSRWSDRTDRPHGPWRSERYDEPACWSWPVPTNFDFERPIWALRAWHKGKCAVCADTVPLSEDHSHETGKTRGWMCRPCNIAEGTQNGVYVLYRQRFPALIIGVEFSYLFTRPWGSGKLAPPLGSRVLNMDAAARTDVDLSGIGRKRTRARLAFDKANEAAKAAAITAAADGVTEVDLAHRLGVDRMTIRSWLGKKR